MIKKLLFAMAIAAVAGNAYAETTTQTVTTQNYVDTNFQTKIPAKTNSLDAVVIATDTAGVTGERGIWGYGYDFYGEGNDYMQDYEGTLTTLEDVRTALKYITTDNTSAIQDPDAIRMIPVFSGNDRVKFWKMITTNSLDNLPWSSTYNIIPSVMAVNSGLDSKQDKMTCAQYITGAEETSENCLLWNVPD